jgi:hypothetical protein
MKVRLQQTEFASGLSNSEPCSPGQRLKGQLRIVMQRFKQSFERLEIGSIFLQQGLFVAKCGFHNGQTLLRRG